MKPRRLPKLSLRQWRSSPDDKDSDVARAGRHEPLELVPLVRNAAIAEVIANVIVEKAAFDKGRPERGVSLWRHLLKVVVLSAGHEPDGQDPTCRIVFGFPDRGGWHLPPARSS